MEDGEKEDIAREEHSKALWAEMTKRKKRRRGQKLERPEACMANFFKGLEVYQTKLLVSAPAPGPCGAPCGARQASARWPRGQLGFLTFPSLLFLLSPLSACSFHVGGKGSERNVKLKRPSFSAQQCMPCPTCARSRTVGLPLSSWTRVCVPRGLSWSQSRVQERWVVRHAERALLC